MWRGYSQSAMSTVNTGTLDQFIRELVISWMRERTNEGFLSCHRNMSDSFVSFACMKGKAERMVRQKFESL